MHLCITAFDSFDTQQEWCGQAMRDSWCFASFDFVKKIVPL